MSALAIAGPSQPLGNVSQGRKNLINLSQNKLENLSTTSKGKRMTSVAICSSDHACKDTYLDAKVFNANVTNHASSEVPKVSNVSNTQTGALTNPVVVNKPLVTYAVSSSDSSQDSCDVSSSSSSPGYHNKPSRKILVLPQPGSSRNLGRNSSSLKNSKNKKFGRNFRKEKQDLSNTSVPTPSVRKQAILLDYFNAAVQDPNQDKPVDSSAADGLPSKCDSTQD